MTEYQLNADHIFRIGSTHKVCEDYAESHSCEFHASASLGDGCSLCLDHEGFPINSHTDFGSRLLVKQSQKIVMNMPHLIDSQDFVEQLLGAHYIWLSQLPITLNTLSSTLINIRSDNNNAFVLTMIGDGVYAARHRQTSKWIVTRLEFISGCPYYLRYECNRLDKERFMTDCTMVCSRLCFVIPVEGDIQFAGSAIDEQPDDATHLTMSFPMSDFDVVVAFSDGIASFASRDENTGSLVPVPLSESIRPFLAFKNLRGEFIQRRASRALDLLEQQGIRYTDDFSMIGVVAGVNDA